MATWGGSHEVYDFEQLSFSIGTQTSEILEDVMENVVLPKLRDYIYRDVYRYSGEQSSKFWDKRTKEGRFIDVWKTRVLRQGFYNNVILYADDYELSKFGEEDPRHRIDTASGLAKVINNGWHSDSYDAPPCGFPVMYARPFWNDFIDWMNANFEDIFLAECNKRGLNMTITGDLKFKKDDN